MSKKFKRRKYFIDPGIQGEYVTVVLIASITAVLITGGTIYFSIWSSILDNFSRPDAIAQLAPVFVTTNKVLLSRLLIGFGLLIFLSIFASHRIAGPLYRVHQEVEKVLGGDLSNDIHLRKNDTKRIVIFSRTLNKFIHLLKNEIMRERNIGEELSSLSERVGKEPSAVKEKLKEIASDINRSTREFKL